MPSISYAITACNEHVELERLLQQLAQNIRPEDEVVIQLDTTATPEVKHVVDSWPTMKRVDFALNGDFASFKNNLKSYCTKDYIFQIDADEYLKPELLTYLPEILELNPDIELYAVPRINTIEGLTQEHINKWGWRINEDGWVNYPDLQWRICKNIPEIQWINKVHEKMIGARNVSYLPQGYELIHPKTIERQEKQNQFYNEIQLFN
jgi:glycosyltransferase involved in cell wall biosynthesis